MKLLTRPITILACLAVALGPLALAASASAVTPSKPSGKVVVDPRPATTLTVTVPKVVPAGQQLVASAQLLRKGGVPVAGAVVTFTEPGIYTLMAQTAVTNAAGTARMGVATPLIGPVTVIARFAGSTSLAPSSGSASTVVARVATRLTLTLPKSVPAGQPFIVSARLVRTDGVPVAGADVTWTQSGIYTFVTQKARTNADGQPP